MNDYDNKLRRIVEAEQIFVHDAPDFKLGERDPVVMGEFIRAVRVILGSKSHVHVASHDGTDLCRVCRLDLRDDIHDRATPTRSNQ